MYRVLERSLDHSLAVGLATTAVGFAAYLAGVWTAYPGRSFSLTAVMVGVTLAAIGRSIEAEGSP